MSCEIDGHCSHASRFFGYAARQAIAVCIVHLPDVTIKIRDIRLESMGILLTSAHVGGAGVAVADQSADRREFDLHGRHSQSLQNWILRMFQRKQDIGEKSLYQTIRSGFALCDI